MLFSSELSTLLLGKLRVAISKQRCNVFISCMALSVRRYSLFCSHGSGALNRMSRLRQIGVSEGKRLDSGNLSGFWQSLFTFGDTADTQVLNTTQMHMSHVFHKKQVQIVLDAFAGVEMSAVAVESSDALQGRGADLQAVHGSALHGSSVISSLKTCSQKLETIFIRT